MENKFYITTDSLVYDRHENQKTYLTEKKKEAKLRIEMLTVLAKEKRKRIKEFEAELNEMLEARKLYKKDEQSVDTEYSYRKKIVALEKKHDFLHVFWDGDDDVYTTWVYSGDFDGEKNYEGDPFQDEHYKDSYESAYETCLEYVKYHERRDK